MINKLKEFWEELMIINEQVIWQNSAERRELAVTRISQLRSFTSGESNINPYDDLYEG